MSDIHLPEALALIKSNFDERKLKNPRYSLRAFARDLDISPGKLSEFLSGRRRLSEKRIEDIISKLNRTP